MDRALPASPVREAEYLVVDTRDYANLAEGLRGCDALVHLAAHRSPLTQPDTVVYNDNTISSYNALSAAAALGISRVCLASSVNALGGAFSRRARYDYFPLDEDHPTYAEDPYSLSKWVLECQADAFARRYLTMQIASLRFHWLMESRERAIESTAQNCQAAVRTFGRTLYSTKPTAPACWRSPLISLATRCFSSLHHVRRQTNRLSIWLATTTLRPRFVAI